MNRTFAVRLLMLCVVALSPLAAGPATQTINITAQRFFFTPNEITIKKGQPVTLVIQSADVTHGLVIEAFGVKTTEVKKGTTAEVTFTADTVGTFSGKCAHFCGKGHGQMILTVHVTE